MFTHLHTHSWFSFQTGVSSPEALCRAAVERGYTALACTDTNGVYGAVEFQQAALAHNLHPILGAHLVAGGQEALALATDDRGWGALCRAITAIHWAAAGGRGGTAAGEPVFSLARQLGADREGLILLSCDTALLDQVARLSGPRDLYAELRPGKERHAVGAAAKRLGLPTVVTGAVQFANPEEWQTHRLRVAIAANAAISNLDHPPPDAERGTGNAERGTRNAERSAGGR
ncbi:MAG TPA: PHP domain-containing protein, partial [Gemmatimonadales bacterium]|nr:PHP domain-containing protein [Gemmatimonadales bacterium]